MRPPTETYEETILRLMGRCRALRHLSPDEKITLAKEAMTAVGGHIMEGPEWHYGEWNGPTWRVVNEVLLDDVFYYLTFDKKGKPRRKPVLVSCWVCPTMMPCGTYAQVSPDAPNLIFGEALGFDMRYYINQPRLWFPYLCRDCSIEMQKWIRTHSEADTPQLKVDGWLFYKANRMIARAMKTQRQVEKLVRVAGP